MTAYTFKQERRATAATAVANVFKQGNVEDTYVSQFVIYNDKGQSHAYCPLDWTEAQVKEAVAELNAQAMEEAKLRAELGDDGYAQYMDENDAG